MARTASTRTRRTAVLLVTACLAATLVAPQRASALPASGPDFDGDGFADLPIGVPGETIGAASEAGLVQVLFGSATGLQGAGSQTLAQGSGGIPGSAEQQDFFGARLAWGDFDGDTFHDLVIGAPGEAVGNVARAGAVYVLFGGASGLDPASAVVFHQDSGGIPGAAEPDDGFGDALAVGDFDGNGRDDLAIGAPSEDVGSTVDAGVVTVLRANDSGTLARAKVFTQETAGVTGASEAGDRFGWSLAAGDLGDPLTDPGDGADLAIGAPGEGVTGAGGAGAVTVLFAGLDGVTGTSSRLLTQGTVGVPGAPEPDDRFGQALAVGPLALGGFDDLAIGVAGEVVVAYEAEGLVHVLPSQGASGPTGAGTRTFRQGAGGVGGAPFEFDSFGAALEIADVSGDAARELLVGVPYDSVAPRMYAGSFHVLIGTATGPTGQGSRWLRQGSDGVPGALETADSFGLHFWSGDYDGDGRTDLTVGAPTEDHSGAIAAGLVIVLEHDGVGVPDGKNRAWSQQSVGVAGTAELQDRFGSR